MERASGDRAIAWTERQRQVLDLIAQGKSNAEIAEALGITIDGAKWHMREILSKLGVATREEAADYWRGHKGLRMRLFRMRRVVAGALGWKLAAGSAALAVGGAAAGVLTVAANGPSATPDAPAAEQVTPANSIFSAQEARDRALAVARAEFPSRIDEFTFLTPIAAVPLATLTSEWHPQVTEVTGADGDRYWAGERTNAWYFRFAADDVLMRGAPNFDGNVVDFPARLEAEVLIEDGTGRALATSVTLLVDGQSKDGGGTFRSHAGDEARRLNTTASGPATTLAWLNGVVGGDRLEIYPTAAGSWCTRTTLGGRDRGSACGFNPSFGQPPAPAVQPLAMGPGPTSTTTPGEVVLVIGAAAAVVRIEIYPAGAAPLTVVPVPAPASVGLPMPVGFAYISFDTGMQPFTVVGYDASGVEVARVVPPGPFRSDPGSGPVSR